MLTLEPRVAFQLGELAVSESVVTTWGLMSLEIGFACWLERRAALRPGRVQNAVEWLFEAMLDLIAAMAGKPERRFVPLVFTLGLSIALANMVALVPGLHSPNADPASPLALALVVFGAVHYYGVQTFGPLGYVRHYMRPWYFLPFRLIDELGRTLSLSLRLFGNILGEAVLAATVLLLAPLLLPVPAQLFGLFVGVLQAYIFCVLTLVYLVGATSAQEAP